MNTFVQTSLGILILLVLIHAEVQKSNINFNEQCQALRCNPSTEICRIKPKCDDGSFKCVYCASKDDIVSKTLLAASASQQQQPLAPRLLAKSGGVRLLADNRASTTKNLTSNELSYDEYYEYDDDDDDDKSDKNEFGEEDEYLDDYAVEPIDSVIQGSDTIRKLGVCPKVEEITGKCPPSNCRFDTDCLGDQKCCEASCEQRLCTSPISRSVSVCPLSFTCTLNCRLGYRTDSNGCLLCECQSCPSMDQCNKNCPSGYLKDLFGCNICECRDQCPPFSCGLKCSPDVGYAKSADGCPLCQCAITKTKPVEHTSSCQDDVHCPPGFRCLNDARNVPMCQAVTELDAPPSPTKECPNNLATTCNLRCSNGNYVLDSNGCPTCACVSEASIKRIGRPPQNCPLYKCRANCGDAGYKIDENGCQTCECASKTTKPRVECSSVMCRMLCMNGYRRDENGCEICQCNDSPQPCPTLKCQQTCPNGYRKDYSGCQTCRCECPLMNCMKNCTNGFETDENSCPLCSCKDDESKKELPNVCSPMTNCNLDCKYGYAYDLLGCPLCSCNRCPLRTCRMFCMYGFKKNADGCDICECDWTPVAENIQCSERVPCTGNRVCNLNLKLCELVSADKVNWFLYDFDVDSELFHDPKFVTTFKNGLINNIAMKYDLEAAQIIISNVELNGLTSFQIMPYFIENMEDFQKKMDQIDNDLNTQEFISVLPSVASKVIKNTHQSKNTIWNRYVQKNLRLILSILAILIGLLAMIFVGVFVYIIHNRLKHPGRSESKSPIFDTPYHQAPTDDDHYHAVRAPDGTAYVVVESEDMHAANDRRALV